MSNSTTPWTAAYQAPLSMGFSRQEYWSGLPLPYLELFRLALLLCIGKRNGNPLKCASLENPGTGEPGGCSLWGHTESDMTEVT